jgi:hypothetical protein
MACLRARTVALSAVRQREMTPRCKVDVTLPGVRGASGVRGAGGVDEQERISDVLLRASIGHLERRAVLRPGLTVIVDAGGGDIGVAEPFLHFGDVGLVIERVGGGRCA